MCMQIYLYTSIIYIYIVIFLRTVLHCQIQIRIWRLVPQFPMKRLVIRYCPFLAGKVSGAITQRATATS